MKRIILFSLLSLVISGMFVFVHALPYAGMIATAVPQGLSIESAGLNQNNPATASPGPATLLFVASGAVMAAIGLAIKERRTY